MPSSPWSPTGSGCAPTALTIVNLVLGLAASVAVVALAPTGSPPARVPAWVVGLVALVGWQVAYALDCADGQLARVTGQASAAGARVDVLCDVAAQIALVAALSARPWRAPGHPGLADRRVRRHLDGQPGDLGDAGRPHAASMVHLDARCRYALVKLVRDYGAVIFAGRAGADPRSGAGRSG